MTESVTELADWQLVRDLVSQRWAEDWYCAQDAAYDTLEDNKDE